MQITLDTMTAHTFGARLRTARKAANMTQDQLAKRAGVTRSAISQWELGLVTKVDAATILRAARALRTTPEALLENDGVADGQAEYGNAPLPDQVRDYWPLLTDRQRAEIVERMQALAESNQDILAQLAGRRD